MKISPQNTLIPKMICRHIQKQQINKVDTKSLGTFIRNRRTENEVRFGFESLSIIVIVVYPLSLKSKQNRKPYVDPLDAKC